jgi:HAE1 family hydrophobic/amphiphilic exporter-1
MQINGLELVTSKSTQGHTSITLQFALSKSIDAAATDVQTAISQATGSLPVDLPSPPTFSKTNPNDQPIMYIALTSDSVTRGQLYDYGSTQIGQRISILAGVSRVSVFGTKSAIRIKADPAAMWARDIAIDELATAIRNGTSYTGAGQFDAASGTALLRPQGQQRCADLPARRRASLRLGAGRALEHALLGARLSRTGRHSRDGGLPSSRRQRRRSRRPY